MTDDRLADLAPHQRMFHEILVDDFERLMERFRQTFVGELEARDKIRYQQYAELRTHLDHRHDAHSREMDVIGEKVEDLTAAVKDGAARLGKLEKRMSASEHDRRDLRARLDIIQAWIDQQPTPEQTQQLIAQLQGVTDWVAEQQGNGDDPAG